MLKGKKRSNKRLCPGIGSGKGKTAGRGTKGQKARGKIPLGFTGGMALYKKLPLRRGKGNLKLSANRKIVTLEKLNIFKAKTVVDMVKLQEANIISAKEARQGVKILDGGEIDAALTVKLDVSETARKKIIKSGGKVENV